MESKDSGEDFELAELVKGIDVIVSGHSHLALPRPVHKSKTIIVQAGAYGRYLGKLALKLVGNAVVVEDHALLELDDSAAGDATVQGIIDSYITALDSVLNPLGLGYRKVVAETSFDLTFPAYQEAVLGNLVTDAYRGTVAALEPGEPVHLAVESGGIIRDEVLAGKTGKLWFADLYRALPLGIGSDMVPGFSLVSFYINSQEVKQGMELTAAARDIMGSNDFFMQVSGVEMEYSPTAPPFNRVTSVKIGGQPIDVTDTSTCYKMVTNYYIGLLLSLVQYLTGGAVVITPKHKDCVTPVADLSTRIVDYDPGTPGIQQLKQWQALSSAVTSFPDTDGDGIPEIPAAYASPQGRIVAR
jgi:5'-nucleotidase